MFWFNFECNIFFNFIKLATFDNFEPFSDRRLLLFSLSKTVARRIIPDIWKT